MKRTLFSLLFAAFAISSFGQTAQPNAAGVSVGHFHLNTKDTDAHKKFWGAIGANLFSYENADRVQIPGVYISQRPEDATAPSEDTTVHHFAFSVKDLQAARTKWQAAGIKDEKGVHSGYMLRAPGGTHIEIVENKAQAEPLSLQHIHFMVVDPDAVQAWYVRIFGATAGTSGDAKTATVPGGQLIFSKTDKFKSATKGKAIDHIGFEVKDLDAFADKLRAAGMTFDVAPQPSINNAKVHISFINDPWGTQIELTQGLIQIPRAKP